MNALTVDERCVATPGSFKTEKKREVNFVGVGECPCMAPPGVVTRGANRLGARTCATMAAPAAGRNVGAGRAATAGPAGGPQLRGRLGGRNGGAGWGAATAGPVGGPQRRGRTLAP